MSDAQLKEIGLNVGGIASFKKTMEREKQQRMAGQQALQDDVAGLRSKWFKRNAC